MVTRKGISCGPCCLCGDLWEGVSYGVLRKTFSVSSFGIARNLEDKEKTCNTTNRQLTDTHCGQDFMKKIDFLPNKKEDWSMHKLECSPMVVFGGNWTPSETVRLTARILAKQKIHPERTPSEKLLAVKEFESHLDKLDNEKRDLIQSDIATLHQFYSKHLGLPDHDSLVVLFAQVNCNGFTIEDEELSHLGSAIFPEPFQSICSSDFQGLTVRCVSGSQGASHVLPHDVPSLDSLPACPEQPAALYYTDLQPWEWPTRSVQPLFCVFLGVALMNHSCCPNVIVTYRGTLAEVRAVQEIHPGEEVFTSYIDLLYPTEDRNDRLRDSYFFTCECRECSTKGQDQAKLEIRKLSDPPRAEAVRDMVRYARGVIEEFRRAKHYKYILGCSVQGPMPRSPHCEGREAGPGSPPSELLEICELSQEQMSSVFEDSNVYMLHMMYQAMGVCLYLQDWEGALRYGQKIIKPYSKHYPLYSLNVASMWLKLGRLYLGLENRAAGEKALKKALAIMEVAHGKDHPYISEIRREIESR
ncbi:SET and MYND domain-containing protein 2 [Heterocephalus glaber]|uniref:[histone H3]-lysine(4) N-trimethyltransferase n=1 Tax=Heterocephalus glaber TaxID=10181 RepID=G5BUS0_HETGA|nr:SET and MYND domain-containing protein 2 [Heterocephalus glaber]